MMRHSKILKYLFISFFSCTLFANEVNIYTSRHYDADYDLYKKFTDKTGIAVNIISGSGSSLVERLKLEGSNSPGDVFFTVDAGNLSNIEKEGLFQSITSPYTLSKVPENLRGPGNSWVAIAKRARVLFYNPESIEKDRILNLNYEDLANKEWEGKIAIRSSTNMYNQSLVASLIVNIGVEATEKWGRNLVKNFARTPQGNDRAQILAVANGEAEIAIANSYYFGIMLSGQSGEAQKKAAEKVAIHFPNQLNRGTHMNISGGGILKHSPNKENAEKFLEFLLSEEAQIHIVNNTFEYPILSNVMPSPYIAQFGTDFKVDEISVSSFGKYNPEAVRLMDRVGWK